MIKNRSQALDVFRGLTVALMILVNNPGTWSSVYPPFLHAPWHGLTPTDLVFPFFLFAVGNALSLVTLDLKKVLKRTVVIFMIGLILNWLPLFTWVGNDLVFKSWTWINADGVEVGLRVMGVLQRIALAYGFAAIFAYFFKRRTLIISLGLLALYWGLCVAFGTGDIYNLEGWFGTGIDRFIFGATHLYQGEGVAFDPEGLMSTLPAISQVLLGFWIGEKLKALPVQMVLKHFFLTGILFIGTALIWNLVHPINKKIWTGSYVLITTGLAVMILGLLVQLLDVKKAKIIGVSFCEAFGKNPLFIFVLSGFIPKVSTLIRIAFEDKFITPLQWFYQNVCALFPGRTENGSLLYAVILLSLYGLLAMWMNKKRIYIRV